MSNPLAAPALAPSRLLIVLAFAAVYVIWGSTYLAIRFAIETLPPLLMAGMRFIAAGVIVYGVFRLFSRETATARQWRGATIVGLFLLLGGNGLVVLAEQTVASGHAALLVATVPMWVVGLEWTIFGKRRPGLPVVIGLITGLAGVATLVGPGEWGGGSIHAGGALALVCACALWSFGTHFSRRVDQPRSPFLFVAMQMIGGGTALLLIGTIRGEWAGVDWTAVSSKSVLSLGYLVVFGAIIALSAYVWLVRVCSPTAVATYAFVNPIVAVLLGWLLADEPLTSRTWAAAVLIVVAVVLVTLKRRPTPARAPAPAQSPIPPAGDAARLTLQEQGA